MKTLSVTVIHACHETGFHGHPGTGAASWHASREITTTEADGLIRVLNPSTLDENHLSNDHGDVWIYDDSDDPAAQYRWIAERTGLLPELDEEAFFAEHIDSIQVGLM